ncbi:MAG: tRNA (adenosine(37)-N6)-dimethylallyltransferase MiaA [Candidatus Paceibacterota bacterium]
MSITLKNPKILVILGPTASGKSDLAVKFAKKFNGEIISADSRQVYKSLNIGSGKITKKEMRGISHYLLDVANPKKTFTASDFQKHGIKAINKIIKKGKLPIICGGSAFYIDSLIYNFSLPSIPPNPKLRAQLEKKSTPALFALLEKHDPARAKNIDRFNRRRLIRSLEIILLTNLPLPPLKKESPYQILKIGIKKSKKELKKRIHLRLLKRMKIGMLKEVKNLHEKQKISWRRLEELGLEYRYLSLYLQNKMEKNAMLEKLETEINRFSKRQLTWWKPQTDIHWIKTEKEAKKLTDKFLN